MKKAINDLSMNIKTDDDTWDLSSEINLLVIVFKKAYNFIAT